MNQKDTTWYFPLDVKMLAHADQDDWGGFEDYDSVDSREAVWYKDAILAQIAKENSHFDTPRMLAEYIHDDALKAKVAAMTPTVVEHGGRLWGAMVMRFAGELSPEETVDLKEYIAGQNADGYGEGLEQRGIPVPDGELYVSFWRSGKDYAVYTQEEFAALSEHRQAEAPTRRKPCCPLLGADGNVFHLMGIAARTLKESDMADAAKEMQTRVKESGGYDAAIAIMMEYVEPTTADSHCSCGFEMKM